MAGHDAAEIRGIMHRRATPLLAGLCAVLALVACDAFRDDTPRAGWERTMRCYAERDYGALWDILASRSRQDTMKVLRHVRQQPRYRESMRVKFDIPGPRLDAMSPREFFIALMIGVERAAPQVMALRAQTARTAEFSRAEIDGNVAVVYWTSPQGGPENMILVKEDNRWRPVVERPEGPSARGLRR